MLPTMAAIMTPAIAPVLLEKLLGKDSIIDYYQNVNTTHEEPLRPLDVPKPEVELEPEDVGTDPTVDQLVKT